MLTSKKNHDQQAFQDIQSELKSEIILPIKDNDYNKINTILSIIYKYRNRLSINELKRIKKWISCKIPYPNLKSHLKKEAEAIIQNRQKELERIRRDKQERKRRAERIKKEEEYIARCTRQLRKENEELDDRESSERKVKEIEEFIDRNKNKEKEGYKP